MTANAKHTTFELNRLAVTLVEAANAGDEGQVLATLSAVQEAEIAGFFTALAGMVPHALRTNPEAGMGDFLGAYRKLIDLAEQRAAGLEGGE